MTDPVVVADPVEQHDCWLLSVFSGENLAVVSEDRLGNPMSIKRLQQPVAHRLGGGPQDQLGQHAEAGGVIDAGDHRQSGSVS